LSVKDEAGVVRAKRPLGDDGFWFDRSRDYLNLTYTDRHSAMDLVRAMGHIFTYFSFHVVPGPDGGPMPDEEFDAEHERAFKKYGPPVTSSSCRRTDELDHLTGGFLLARIGPIRRASPATAEDVHRMYTSPSCHPCVAPAVERAAIGTGRLS
jgi:hypothetical protein